MECLLLVDINSTGTCAIVRRRGRGSSLRGDHPVSIPCRSRGNRHPVELNLATLVDRGYYLSSSCSFLPPINHASHAQQASPHALQIVSCCFLTQLCSVWDSVPAVTSHSVRCRHHHHHHHHALKHQQGLTTEMPCLPCTATMRTCRPSKLWGSGPLSVCRYTTSPMNLPHIGCSHTR